MMMLVGLLGSHTDSAYCKITKTQFWKANDYMQQSTASGGRIGRRVCMQPVMMRAQACVQVQPAFELILLLPTFVKPV